MPVYVYKNLTTGATFEVEQRITESALTADPATGDPVKRVIQPVGIAFKGSGFYVTDSRGKNGAAKPAARSDAPKTESPSGEATKGDTPKADAPHPPTATASASSVASGTD
jgi:predicted nucleic acid-binding Zn ribbon protein